MEYVTRQEAIKAGKSRYFVGKLCPNGHIVPYLVAGGCSMCANIRDREKPQVPVGDVETSNAAFLKGHTTYVSILPCPKGHIERYVSSGRCTECTKIKSSIRSKKWRAENVEACRERDKKRYAESDPVERRAKMNAWKKKNLERKAGRLKPSNCEICDKESKTIAFDHCHATGKFRGWLCLECNRTIGLHKDDPKVFRAMAAYLERHQSGSSNDNNESNGFLSFGG